MITLAREEVEQPDQVPLERVRPALPVPQSEPVRCVNTWRALLLSPVGGTGFEPVTCRL